MKTFHQLLFFNKRISVKPSIKVLNQKKKQCLMSHQLFCVFLTSLLLVKGGGGGGRGGRAGVSTNGSLSYLFSGKLTDSTTESSWPSSVVGYYVSPLANTWILCPRQNKLILNIGILCFVHTVSTFPTIPSLFPLILSVWQVTQRSIFPTKDTTGLRGFASHGCSLHPGAGCL